MSFHEADAFDDLLQVGGEFARAPFMQLELRDDRTELVGAPIPSWPSGDEGFALALRMFQESAKSLLRGEAPKRPLDVVVKGIHAAREPGLRNEAWDLYERSWSYLQRAGIQGVAEGSA